MYFCKRYNFNNTIMVKKFLISVVAFVLFAWSMFAQMVLPQAPLALDSTVVYGKLDNGFTYYIKHNVKPAQRADFYIVTNVGAIQETPAQDGLAHFLEHMCFNGTKNFPDKGIISYMESIGAKFGENINAGTGVEMTSYMLNNIPVIRDGIIDSSLLVLHDWSAFVTNDPKEIDNERGVILEEKRTRNTYQWRERNSAFEALFKGSKYATCSLIGSEENLKTFKPEELVSFYKTWYRPDMQAIIVVGDVDVKSVENKIKTLFGQIPAAENPKAKNVILIPDNQDPIVSVFTDKEYPSTSVSVYFKSQPLPIEYRGLGLSALMDLYKGLISLMLNERFTDITTRPDAPFLSAGGGFATMCATMECFYGEAQAKDGESLEAMKALYVELERAKRFGFTQDEFDRAKTKLLRSYERAAENASSRQNGQIVNNYIEHFINGIPFTAPEYMYGVVKGYFDAGMVALDNVNKIMSEVITPSNMVVLLSAPQKDGLVNPTEEELLGAITAAKSEDIKPLEGESVDVPLLDAEALTGSNVKSREEVKFGAVKLVLDNGIEIYVKPTDFKKDEVVIKTVGLGGKSILDTEMLPSFEMNVAQVFTQYSGVSDFPVAKLQKMLTGKAVSVLPYISSIAQGVSASGSPKDLETMLQLMYLYYTAPRFEANEIEVGLNQIKAVLPNILKQPNFIFQNRLTETLYGNSPRVPVLSEDMMSKVSVENYKKAYEKLFSDAAGVKVYITGNVNVDEILPLLQKYIGSLPVKSAEGLMYKDDNRNIVKGNIENVFAVPMEAPKTTVALIYSGDMKYNLENNILMESLKYILDMTYTKTIREDEGGTYGVGVMAEVNNRPNEDFVLLVTFDTELAKSEKLIQLAIDGFKDIAENGVSEEYVAKTKENFLKAFPEQHIRNGYWLEVLDKYYGQNYDCDTEFVSVVEKCVNSANIQRIAKEIIAQGNMIKFIMNPQE